jgi:hypothetical protein
LHRNAAELAEQGLLPEPVREFVAKDRGCRELDRFLGCFERRLHRELSEHGGCAPATNSESLQCMFSEV